LQEQVMNFEYRHHRINYKFEEEGENKNIKGVFQGIYNAYSKLIMNPFFDKNELNDIEKQSKIKNSFLKSIEKVVNNE